MMPYLSVIKDSFREAMSSRVLWLVLALITAVLIALLPFHWVGTIGAKMDGSDIRSIRNIAVELKLGDSKDATPLQRKIWDAVSSETRQHLEEVNRGTPGPHRFFARETLAQDFNKLIKRGDFFQPELWADIELSTRLQELLDQDQLSPELGMQRNRLALEAALPGMLRTCPEESMLFRYAKWDLSYLPAMTRSRAAEQINWIVMVALPMFVGFFGIFAAVLVTAPIIPNMLASGSLNLLLSKPIARSLLFLAKFVGGCSFVFINVFYLVAGICLILGLRFQMWKPQLLWAIPIFLFSFAIFYSVSAVSGLIWRSTVLAIAMTVMFWVLCATVGTTRGLMEQFIIVPDRISQLIPTDDGLFVQRSNGTVGRWNASTKVIDEIMETRDAQPAMMMTGPKYAGMIYDPQSEMLLALSQNWSEANIYAALKANRWKRELPTKGPKNSLSMFLRMGKPTIVSEDGVYEISMAQAVEPLADINIFGLKIPAPAPKDSHEKISLDFPRLPSGTRVAFSPQDDRIYLQYSRNLKQFAPQDGKFADAKAVRLDEDEVTHLAAGKGVVVLANRQESTNSLHVFAAQNLAETMTLKPEGDDQVRALDVSNDGRWLAMLTDDDALTVFDLQDKGNVRWRRNGVSAVLFQNNALFTSDLRDRVATLSLPELKQVNQLKPTLPLIKRIYSYVVNPVYLVCPKPSELENTMRYALTGKDTEKVEGPGMGPNGRTVKLDPWQPLYSNSVFIAVMLLLGCWYVHRQDF